jgi:hypothetical protein
MLQSTVPMQAQPGQAQQQATILAQNVSGRTAAVSTVILSLKVTSFSIAR